MKIAPGPATRVDPRAEALPLRIDDDGTARWVQSARTTEDAWRYLGLPGPPDVTNQLAEAATALCRVSDSIGTGLQHFGTLAADADPPAAWIDRMVTLHVEELEGYWRLDDLAYAGLEDGGWTATTPGQEPPADDPGDRRARRARWQTDGLKPPTGVLAIDRARRALDRAERVETVEEAGRALVQAATRHRFFHWRATRQETAS